MRSEPSRLKAAPCRPDKTDQVPTVLSPVVVPVRDLLTLFEHVIFGLVVGNPGRRRGLLAILRAVAGVLVVDVLILGGCCRCWASWLRGLRAGARDARQVIIVDVWQSAAARPTA